MTDPAATATLRDAAAVKAASERLGLPVSAVSATTPSVQALALVPEAVAREHRLIPVSLVGTTLTLALADPSLLSQPAPAFLQALKTDRGLTLQLTLTTGAELEAGLTAYQKTGDRGRKTEPALPAQNAAPVAPKSVDPSSGSPKAEPIPASVHSSQVPSVDLRGRVIPRDVLERFPDDVARKYQVVVFALSPDGTEASVAAVDPALRTVRDILKHVEQRNGIRIQLYQTSKESLAAALAGYGQAPPQPPVTQPSTPPAQLVRLNRATNRLRQAAQTPSPPPRPPMVAVSPPVPVPPVAARSVPTPTAVAAVVRPPVDRLPDRQINRQSDQQAARPPASTTRASVLATPAAQLPIAPPVVPDENNLDLMLGGQLTEAGQLTPLVASGQVPRIVAGLIGLAAYLRASDVHVEAGAGDVRIRIRVDGDLQEVVRLPAILLAPLVSRIKILSRMKIDESRIPQDGRFDVLVAGRGIDLRVSTLPTVHGEKVVLRLLDKAAGLKGFDELGLRGTNLARVKEVIDDPFGIVLVTGPTGSGKTTTLYAMLNVLNQPDVNIVTLEDPVEYQLPGVNQTQVRPKIGFGFADGLRSILRQDPNIIMVGEIRDRETAALATQAALTGHLVLATLHTNNAAGAIPRLLDMGVEPFLLASSLKAVIGQRLVRRLVPETRRAVSVPADTATALQQELAAATAAEAKAAAGQAFAAFEAAPGTAGTGYKGRLGIFEVLTVSEAIADLTLRKVAADEIEAQALAEGMLTLRQDGLLKVLAGDTSLNEVLQLTEES